MRLKNERPRKILIKGIPIDIPLDEIKSELLKLNFEIHRISQLKNFKTKTPLPIFLLDVFRNENFKNIFDLTSLLGFLIRVETYRFKGSKQCYNCQRFNHSSEICKLSPVCVKCSGSHRPSECKIENRSQIKCANCQGNHTANFGGCPKNPKNLNKNSNNKPNTIRNSSQYLTTNQVKENLSFAAATAGNPPPPPANSNSDKNSPSTSTAPKIPVNPPKVITSKKPHSQLDDFNYTQLLYKFINCSDNIDIIIAKVEKLLNLCVKLSHVLNANPGTIDLLCVNSNLGSTQPPPSNVISP